MAVQNFNKAEPKAVGVKKDQRFWSIFWGDRSISFLTTQTAGASTRTYTTDSASNRLAALSNLAQSLSYGSQTGDGSATYAYNVRGRLSSAVTAAGTTTYQVNDLGPFTFFDLGSGNQTIPARYWGNNNNWGNHDGTELG